MNTTIETLLIYLAVIVTGLVLMYLLYANQQKDRELTISKQREKQSRYDVDRLQHTNGNLITNLDKAQNRLKEFGQNQAKIIDLYNLFNKQFLRILSSPLGAKGEEHTYMSFVNKRDVGVTIERKQGTKKQSISGVVGYVIDSKFFISKESFDKQTKEINLAIEVLLEGLVAPADINEEDFVYKVESVSGKDELLLA